MKNIRSIYSQDTGIRLPGLSVRRIRLNRHLPEAQWIAAHQHPYSQILLYLGGTGSQSIAGRRHLIEKGHLFFIPPRVKHAFLEPAGQKPLCLAVDFDYKDGNGRGPMVQRLNSMEFGQVRHALAGLNRWRNGREKIEPGEAAEVLRLIEIFFRALHLLRGRASGPEQSALFQAVQRALHEEAAFREPLSHLAQRIGYHPDYLNRVLKQICGSTLGELRAEMRLRRCTHLLASTRPISDVAESAGFDDPNYFARWFREQTGRTPTAWRRGRTTADDDAPAQK